MPDITTKTKPRGYLSEDKPKRKTHTSTEVKMRYNRKVYSLVAARVPKELAANFRARIEEYGDTSIAGVIRDALTGYLDTHPPKTPPAGQAE